ncbi:Uncharacterized protein PBTT_02874 [Plasmodiophora brassicae]
MPFQLSLRRAAVQSVTRCDPDAQGVIGTLRRDYVVDTSPSTAGTPAPTTAVSMISLNMVLPPAPPALHYHRAPPQQPVSALPAPVKEPPATSYSIGSRIIAVTPDGRRRRGVLLSIPEHPSTWFSVLLDGPGHEIVSLRRGAIFQANEAGVSRNSNPDWVGQRCDIRHGRHRGQQGLIVTYAGDRFRIIVSGRDKAIVVPCAYVALSGSVMQRGRHGDTMAGTRVRIVVGHLAGQQGIVRHSIRGLYAVGLVDARGHLVVVMKKGVDLRRLSDVVEQGADQNMKTAAGILLGIMDNTQRPCKRPLDKAGAVVVVVDDSAESCENRDAGANSHHQHVAKRASTGGLARVPFGTRSD